MADTNRGIWTCKIGEVDRAKLPSGSDNYMRDALGDVYESLVGERPTFIFSGWGGELTEPERAVVEDREPAQPMADTLSTEEILSIFPKAVVEEIQQEWAAFIADEYNSRSWTALYHLAKAFAPPPRFIAIDPDELRALRESHDALERALRELVECEELEIQSYGSFPGGDPRCFTPDEEVNTPAELAAWKAACEAWERGEGQDTGPQCQTMGDGSVVTRTGFGMGVTRWTHPAVEVARAALAKAEALHG